MSFCGFIKADLEVIVTIGPFVDVGDGFTPQTDITLGGNEAELLKHGSDTVVSISGATWAPVADCRGNYSLTLTASHTDTEGLLTVIVQDDSDCLPVRNTFMVLNAKWFDALFTNAGDRVEVDLREIAGDPQSSTDLKDFADEGYNPATNKVQGVVLTDTATAVTDDVGITQAGADKAWGTAVRAITDKAGFSISGAKQTLDALNDISTANVDATITANADIINLVTRLSAARAGYLDELAAAAMPADLDAVKAVTDLLPNGGLLTDLATAAALNTVAGYLDTEIDAIKAVTDLLPNAGALTDIDTGVNNLETRLSVARAGYLDELAAANIPTDLDAVKAVTDLLPNAGALTDIDTGVNNLETRLTAARGGYLDELDASTPGKSSYYIAKMMIALVNKMITTELTGDVEQFNDADATLGSILAAFDSDGDFTTRKRMVK